MSVQSRLKRGILYLVGILFIVIILLAVTDNNYVYRGAVITYLQGHSTAHIDDYVDFDNRTIKASTHIAWQKHPDADTFHLTDELKQAIEGNDDTISFAVIKDGKVLYENYWQGYSADSQTNSFSMAKSMVTMLYLKAVEDGYIAKYDEPITTFLPEYANDKNAQQTTLADLSAMTSGYDWIEHYYLPINPTAKAYYGKDLIKQILSRSFKKTDGKFHYSSGSTQLLAIALSRALKPHGYTLSSYLEKSFWQPLGMKNDAYWSLDGSSEIEKAYCCISASTMDFAKFGQMLLNDGNYNGKQILSKEHVKLMKTPNTSAFKKGKLAEYGYSLWMDMEAPTPYYAMIGHLGQRVIVLPKHNVIITRLGKAKTKLPRPKGFRQDSVDVPFYVNEIAKSLDKLPKKKDLFVK